MGAERDSGPRAEQAFMEPFAAMDLTAVLADKGFKAIAVTPFEAAEGALDPGNPNWRFPWTLISVERAA